MLVLLVALRLIFLTSAIFVRRPKTGSSRTTSSSSNSFHTALLNSSYERSVSPFETDGEPVVVYIQTPSVVLFSVEENKQLVSYVAALNFTWTDSRLAFDPEETGFEYTIIPSNMVWIPTIACYNRTLVVKYNGSSAILKEGKPDYALGMRMKTDLHVGQKWDQKGIQFKASIDVNRIETEKETSEVLVTYNGTVTLFQRARYDTICDCDISDFPFDTQFCSIGFDTGLSAADRMQLVPLIQSNYFRKGNAEWDLAMTAALERTDNCSGYSYSFAVLGFTLKRNSQFYIYFLILPTFIVTSTCITAVLLPSSMSAGERMSTGIAGLLGLTFLLSIIVAEVPRSVKLPILGKWVIAEMSFCVIAMIFNAIGMKVESCCKRSHRFGKRVDLFVSSFKLLCFLVVFLANVTFTIVILVNHPARVAPPNYNSF